MKRFLFMVTFACVAMFAACEYDDSALVDRMDGFESRLERLEELCAQMNTNISSLQTIVNALQQKDFITTVAPINKDGKEVGYSITFSSGKSITIYHGYDGKDGEDGTDGKTPQIGVKQDTDGVYYWTVDGEWLTDADGAKIQAAAEDGADGEDGKDGTTPQLKIEDDYWYVSYDNGATWAKLGKATGEDGSDGSDGTSDDNIFQSVTQDSNNVYFKLADGTTITIPKSTSAENIVLTYIPRYSDGKATVFYNEKSDSYVELDFEVSPASAAANWRSIASVKAVYTETRAGVEFVDMAILDWSTDTAKGTITVKASGKNLSDAFFAGTQDASARLVVSGDGVNIISDYVPMVAVKSGSTSTIQPNNEIWYTSTDGKIVVPNKTDVFGANIVSNTYENGKGVIKFDGDVTEIGNYAFRGCNNLKNITIPNKTTWIGAEAFQASTLTNINIPNSVTCINYKAFGGSNLTSVIIPNSVIEIDDEAFYGCCSLVSITIPNSVDYIGDSVFFGCTGELIIDSKMVEKYGFNQYLHGNKFNAITIGNSITNIAERAFQNCANLNSVTIGNNVTTIGNYAFSCCYSLTNVAIGNGVTVIGDSAFELCRSLTSIAIPDSVTEIRPHAFYGCWKLSKFYGRYASADKRCIVINGVLKSFAWGSKLTSYTIPDNVTTICYGAFTGYDDIKSITIPDSVSNIEGGAFGDCDCLSAFYGKFATTDNKALIIDDRFIAYAAGCNLNIYTIPDDISIIERGAFCKSIFLGRIIIPDSVTIIKDSAFSFCLGLQHITIPNSVTKIGSYAFSSCEKLANIIIPNSVIEIGNCVFIYCSSLTSVYCKPTIPPTGGSNMFESISTSAKIYVPVGSGAVYKAVKYWSDYASIIEEKAM